MQNIRTIERKWIRNFSKSPLVDNDNQLFRPKIAEQLFYGRSDQSYSDEYPNDFCELNESYGEYTTEDAINYLLEFLHFIGIKIRKEAIDRHLAKFPDDIEKLFRKVYYILKALAYYEEDLDISNPYYDNNGDLYFLLRIESEQSTSVGQLSLFEDIELPDLYSKFTFFPDGYEEDEEVAELFSQIENSNTSYFITGKAGTGKSTFIHYFAQKTNKQVLLTAFTGIAAINIGGVTLHSFFRLPLKPLLPNDEDIPIFQEYFQKRRIIERIDTIVIDEVSMLRADIIEALDYSLRKNGGDPSKKFGGKQIVLAGDLFQLPPVTDSHDEVEQFIFSDVYDSPYFFDSHSFKEINPILHEFTKSFRQAKDHQFVELLDRVRFCQVDQSTLDSINSRYKLDYIPNQQEFVITLTSTNYIANEENRKKIEAIPYTKHIYEAEITGEFKEKKYPTSKFLQLKKNAQVIFVKNDLERRWVNGTIAKIDFISKDFIEARLANGQVYKVEKEIWENRNYKYDKVKKKILSEVIGTFKQYPFKLAWAITIHKSQGLTFDNVIIDIGSGAFVNGQVYTALSRSRKLSGIILKRKIKQEDIIADPRIIKFHRESFKN